MPPPEAPPATSHQHTHTRQCYSHPPLHIDIYWGLCIWFYYYIQISTHHHSSNSNDTRHTTHDARAANFSPRGLLTQADAPDFVISKKELLVQRDVLQMNVFS